jgi:hypothetical protein
VAFKRLPRAVFGWIVCLTAIILIQAAIVNAAPNLLQVARYLDKNTVGISDNRQSHCCTSVIGSATGRSWQ